MDDDAHHSPGTPLVNDLLTIRVTHVPVPSGKTSRELGPTLIVQSDPALDCHPVFRLTSRSRDDDRSPRVFPETIELRRIPDGEHLQLAVAGHLEPHRAWRRPPFTARRDSEKGVQRPFEQCKILITKHEINLILGRSRCLDSPLRSARLVVLRALLRVGVFAVLSDDVVDDDVNDLVALFSGRIGSGR
jgi:hypothetical protein